MREILTLDTFSSAGSQVQAVALDTGAEGDAEGLLLVRSVVRSAGALLPFLKCGLNIFLHCMFLSLSLFFR